MAGYGILADGPDFYGLLSSLAVYAVVSLLTRPADAAVPANWRERPAGRGGEGEDAGEDAGRSEPAAV